MGMVREVRGTPTVTAYVDASYGVHPDMKSHTGCLVTLGAGPIFAKSGSQKLNTKSSTEAELVGMSDSGNQVNWKRNFLSALYYDMPPAAIYQDNMSVLRMVEVIVTRLDMLILNISFCMIELSMVMHA
jgi:hypothetical protein